MEGQRHLDEPGGSGGGLGVADLGLHRAQSAPAGTLLVLRREDRRQAPDLRGVSGLRRRAVGLHELDGGRAVPRLLVRPSQSTGLAFRAGRVHAGPLSVGRSSEPSDDGVDGIPVGLGILETPEGEHTHTLADEGAVGLVGERPAVPRGGERRRLREAHVHEDVVEGVDAPGDDHVAVTQVELVEPGLQRRDGAGARRAGDEVGAAQVQPVGDAAGDHVPQQPGEGALLPGLVVVLDALDDLLDPALGQARVSESLPPDGVLEPRAHLHHQLGGRGHAQDYAGAAVVRVVGEPAGVLEDPLRRDEGEELGRVRRRDGRRREPELHGVEGDRVQVPTPLGVRHVRRAGIGIVVVLDQPGVGRNVGETVRGRDDVAPEAKEVLAPREKGAHAYDGNGIGGRHRSIHRGVELISGGGA